MQIHSSGGTFSALRAVGGSVSVLSGGLFASGGMTVNPMGMTVQEA